MTGPGRENDLFPYEAAVRSGDLIDSVIHFSNLGRHRVGILGWFLNSRILRRKRLSSFQLRIYNLFVPLFKLEKFFPLPFGISLLAVGEKSG